MGASCRDEGTDPVLRRETLAVRRPITTVKSMGRRASWRSRAYPFVALVALVLLAACSAGGSGLSADAQRANACALIARLPASADALTNSGVADPDAFQRELDAAVLQYSGTLRALESTVPSSLADDVARVRRRVNADDFTGALAARAPIDRWARANCH